MVSVRQNYQTDDGRPRYSVLSAWVQGDPFKRLSHVAALTMSDVVFWRCTYLSKKEAKNSKNVLEAKVS